MAADPQFPIDRLRESFRTSSMMLPPPNVLLTGVADRTIPGPAGEIPVRVYTPQGDGPFPVTVYFNGGGFVVGDLNARDMIARGLAAGAGSVVVSVDYRLAPEHRFPAAAEDCWEALSWATSHAAEINGAPDKLALAGDSADGVLASVMAIQSVQQGGSRLSAVFNWYGPCNHPVPEGGTMAEFENGPLLRADDVRYFRDLYGASAAQDEDFRAGPIKAKSHAGLPPHFIASADAIRSAMRWNPMRRAAWGGRLS